MRVNIGMPVVRTDGRSVYDHVITKFSRMVSLPYFLTHGAPQARFARQSSAIKRNLTDLNREGSFSPLLSKEISRVFLQVIFYCI